MVDLEHYILLLYGLISNTGWLNFRGEVRLPECAHYDGDFSVAGTRLSVVQTGLTNLMHSASCTLVYGTFQETLHLTRKQ